MISTSKDTGKRSSGRIDVAPDATSLLTSDHEQVKFLFEQYEAFGERAYASKKNSHCKSVPN